MDPPEQGAENAAQKNELNRTDEVVTETIIELNQTDGVSTETKIETGQTYEEVTKTITELNQTDDVVACDTIESARVINASDRQNDQLDQERIEPIRIIGESTRPDVISSISGPTVTDHGADEPGPNEIDKLFDGIDFSNEPKYYVEKNVKPPEPVKPYRLMLKNAAIIAIFAAVFYGARRMKKKIYG